MRGDKACCLPNTNPAKLPADAQIDGQYTALRVAVSGLATPLLVAKALRAECALYRSILSAAAAMHFLIRKAKANLPRSRPKFLDHAWAMV
jgi:hypothetical protein